MQKTSGDIYEYLYVSQFPPETMIDTLEKVLSLTGYQIVPFNQLYDKDISLSNCPCREIETSLLIMETCSFKDRF